MASKSNASRTVARAPAQQPEPSHSPATTEGEAPPSPMMPLVAVGVSVVVLLASITFYVARSRAKQHAADEAAAAAVAAAEEAKKQSVALVEGAKTPETHAVAAI